MCIHMAVHRQILESLGNGTACRNLFGPVDREQLQVEYKDALQKDIEDASRRWGFDFVLEKPLEGGDFQWEGVSGACMPALYHACAVGDMSWQREVESTAVTTCGAEPRLGQSAGGKENVPRSPERHISSLEKTPEKTHMPKRKQTNITDFYQAKRRIVATPRKSGQ
ncbi:hypothetical protein P4O66_006587 [Electrophorus voltai]|uniref:Cyclin-dependent kinase inhibitor domain-containing protein n=2 Tax=Electrophorus TaxID=8004 RepID=A0A4W4G6L0_ELEEL|nr:cyclin-dependent kinase inhibitor 1 isoform X2 [Electrophorus electricus]XP_026881223.1 cyclin-dependent kinase inhibitor 1 isoform X2 [Electrophorus electricus]XP_026881225.1 cyclin-dependent kinase inhibitor 1 isoform X2 [Electrophorus electricus]KAK1800110.1 hypothetical protein P4O66_006587 [Electrophorus voltai]